MKRNLPTKTSQAPQKKQKLQDAGPSNVFKISNSSNRAQKFSIGNEWGDDEFDEDLVLATQNVEKEFFYSQSQHNETYSNYFGKLDEFKSSTQIRKEQKQVVVLSSAKDGIPTQYQGYTEEIRNKLFEDDDDQFNDILNESKRTNEIQTIKEQPPQNDVFRHPGAISTFNQHIPTSQKENNQKEIQIEYFTRKNKALNQQTDKLRKITSDLSEKIQTKDNEIQSLKQEMKNFKQTVEKLKLEKMKESENIKNQWIIEKRNLEEKLETLALQKETENNFEQQYRRKCGPSPNFQNQPNQVIRNIPNIFNIICIDMHPTPDMKIDKKIFESSVDDSISAAKCGSFQKEKKLLAYLTELQSTLSEIYVSFKESNGLSVNGFDEIWEKTPEIIRTIERNVKCLEGRNDMFEQSQVNEFGCQSRSLDNGRNSLVGNTDLSKIYQKEKYSPDEEGAVIRRIIATYVIICENSSRFSEKILTELMDKERTMIQILTECVNIINKSFKTTSYVGVLTSIAMLLKTLSEHYYNIKTSSRTDDMVVGLFKAILFCRADDLVTISALSSFLLNLSQHSESIRFHDKLCVQSQPADCFTFIEQLKLIQFTDDSCLVQIYATLLETAVNQYDYPTENEVNFLIEIAINTLRFFRFFLVHFEKQPTFLVDPNCPCNCYTKLCNVVIILLHLSLKFNISNETDTQKLIHLVKLGVLVLSDVFGVIKKTNIFDGNSTMYKNRMFLVCDWLKIIIHRNPKKFEKVHDEALKVLNFKSTSLNQNRQDVDNIEDNSVNEKQNIQNLLQNFF